MRESRSADSQQGRRSCSKRPPARLKKRADFVKAAKAPRAEARGFSLRALKRGSEAEEAPPRFGFTVTKKVGSAVVRNRIRRRLKEALRLTQGLSARPGHDYVILARRPALDQEFAALQAELARAFIDVHVLAGARRPRGTRATRPRPSGGAASAKKD